MYTRREKDTRNYYNTNLNNLEHKNSFWLAINNNNYHHQHFKLEVMHKRDATFLLPERQSKATSLLALPTSSKQGHYCPYLGGTITYIKCTLNDR